jgi:hypothetical protein
LADLLFNIPFKGETLFLLDKLGFFRNPIMHAREQMLEHQRHLCLGICGELFLYTHTWHMGYRRQVKKYYCIFRFSPCPGDEPNNTEVYVVRMAKDWLKIIEDNTSIIQ